MNITDDQLLAFRDAARRSDHVSVHQIIQAIREQNPVASGTISDTELQIALFLRVASF